MMRLSLDYTCPSCEVPPGTTCDWTGVGIVWQLVKVSHPSRQRLAQEPPQLSTTGAGRE